MLPPSPAVQHRTWGEGITIAAVRTKWVNLHIGWRRHRLAIGVSIAIVILTVVFGLYSGFRPISLQGVIANLFFQGTGVLAISMAALLVGLALHRPPSPFDFVRTHPFIRHKSRRLVQAIPILIAASVFLPAFSALKSQVGTLYPYVWDPFFIELDIAIHGTDPWRILQPVIGYPFITFIIAMAYQIWILLLYIMLPLLCIWMRSRILAGQVLTSYFMCWFVIGGLFANLFASVGPCFVDPFFGNRHFVPLMDYLNAANEHYPLMFLDVQASLIEWQQKGESELGRGISAMPSMHVSVALLFYLATRQLSKVAGWFFGVFFLIILIGSVHTGYHYAVDGYASIILTLAIWFGAGWFVRRRIGPMNYAVNQRR